MAYMYKPGTRKPMADINVVPFIDVMLVLLVIFMITAPLLTQGVKVELPKTTAQALPDQKQEPLIVTVDSKGKYYLNIADKPTTAITPRVLENLVKKELAALKTGQTRAVLVRGDKSANYGNVLEVMALLQKSGAKSVGLITQPIPDNNKTG